MYQYTKCAVITGNMQKVGKYIDVLCFVLS